MRKIIVFDVPAEFGGVMTILHEVYEEALRTKDIQWEFIVGKANLKSKGHVTVRKYPWVKKSWFHRLFFDFFVAPKIARKSGADVIFSLENVAIRGTKLPQVLYMQQALMFSDHKYSFSESKTYWFYQNILSRSTFSAMRKCKTIVQTKWMKEAAVQMAHAKPGDVYVVAPHMTDYEPVPFRDTLDARRCFFYPVGCMPYKHHDTIIDAAEALNAEDFKVIFTSESPAVREMAKKAEKHIDFAGSMLHEKVIELYGRSVLVFASELESFGLPLMEARIAGSIIFTADTPFAREILCGYPNAYFFPVGDSVCLARYMQQCISGELKYSEDIPEYRPDTLTGWSSVVQILKSAMCKQES